MTTPTTLPSGSGFQSIPLQLENKPEGLPVEASPDPEREAKILAWSKEAYSQCKNARSLTERQWYINMSFYFGKQNITMLNSSASVNGFQLYTPPAPPWRVRMIVNKVRSIIRTELAKVTGPKPRFTVVPATSEDKDLTAARVAEQIFDATYSNKNLKHTIKRTMWWTLICGSSFIKDYWDEGLVDKYSDQQGDFSIEMINPFHVFVPDLVEEEIENQPYLIHAMTKSIPWAKRNYPQLAERKIEPNAKGTNDILDDAFLGIIGARDAMKQEVLLLEIWIKPDGAPGFPEGGLVTIVGDHVVQILEEYPYKHGDYPFSKIDHMPSGKFYGDSVIIDLIPLQREYNRTRSQIIEAKNLMGKPKLLVAKGSVDVKKITSEPGQAIEYIPGFNPPSELQHAPLPQHVLNEIQQLQTDMDDIAGQHEISRGQNPSQVTAASALSFLKEQDDTKLSATIDSLENAVEKLGRHILSHVVQFWDTERTVRIVGKDGQFDAQQFKGDDVGANLDVRVEAGSALPGSKAGKQAFVMELMKMGFIPPEKGLEMLDLGGVERVYEDYLVDVRQAQRENQRMMEGEQTMPNDFDNHQVHLEVHNKFRKGQEYEALGDEVKQVFQMHVQLHSMAMQSGMLPGGIMPPMMPEDPNDPNGMPGGMPGDPAQSQEPPQGQPQGQPPPADMAAMMQGAP